MICGVYWGEICWRLSGFFSLLSCLATLSVFWSCVFYVSPIKAGTLRTEFPHCFHKTLLWRSHVFLHEDEGEKTGRSTYLIKMSGRFELKMLPFWAEKWCYWTLGAWAVSWQMRAHACKCPGWFVGGKFIKNANPPALVWLLLPAAGGANKELECVSDVFWALYKRNMRVFFSNRSNSMMIGPWNVMAVAATSVTSLLW